MRTMKNIKKREIEMFKFLQEINVKLYQRYLTLEKNIKVGSNSFYDAYLKLTQLVAKTHSIT